MAQRDTREEAAEWISKHIAKGSVIGVMRPIYSVAPPIDEARYKVRALGYKFESQDMEGLDYFVVAGYPYISMLPEMDSFVVEKIFTKYPHIGPIRLKRRELPIELRSRTAMKFVQPEMVIFKPRTPQ